MAKPRFLWHWLSLHPNHALVSHQHGKTISLSLNYIMVYLRQTESRLTHGRNMEAIFSLAARSLLPWFFFSSEALTMFLQLFCTCRAVKSSLPPGCSHHESPLWRCRPGAEGNCIWSQCRHSSLRYTTPAIPPGWCGTPKVRSHPPGPARSTSFEGGSERTLGRYKTPARLRLRWPAEMGRRFQCCKLFLPLNIQLIPDWMPNHELHYNTPVVLTSLPGYYFECWATNGGLNSPSPKSYTQDKP